MSDHQEPSLGMWSVAAIGVGGMVGGGIFAVLGLAVQLAHGGTPVAFAVAGVVALLTTSSYVRLSVAFPSDGGTVSFLDKAWGPGAMTGGLNVLLWISYIVMLALYSFAFGSYAAAFFPEPLRPVLRHVFLSASIVGISGLNLLSASVIGRAETFIVALKVAILLVFVFLGLRGVDGARLAPGTWSSPLDLVAGGMIIFLAYEGFELIANTAKDVRSPERTLPRAYYLSVGFVIALYVLVAIVTVGNLAIPKIVDAKDYALARAAEPFLGSAGFTLIAVAALLSTASAINATLYGAARLSYNIAKDGELPAALEKKVWSEPVEGLVVTAVLALLLGNLFDLSSISTMGSAGFLLVFFAVNLTAWRLAGETKGGRVVPLVGAGACAAALVALVWRTAATDPRRILVLVGMLAVAYGVEFAYRFFAGRRIRLPRP